MSLYPLVKPKFFANDTNFALGYKLFFYDAGTTTKRDTTDGLGGATNPNPILLDARGEPDNAGTPIDIYLADNVSYKVVFTTDTDTDPPSSPIWTVDDVITGSAGGGGGVGETTQWVNSTVAVRTSATQFTVAGVDVTGLFKPGRRIECIGGADRFATVVTSSFAIDTLVTVTDTIDDTDTPSTLHASMTNALVLILDVSNSSEINAIIGILRTSLTVGDGSADSNGINLNQTTGLEAYAINANETTTFIDAINGRLFATGIVASGSSTDDNLVTNNAYDFGFDGWKPSTIGGSVSVLNDATEGNYFNMPDNVSTYTYTSQTFKLSPQHRYRIKIRAAHSVSGAQVGFVFRVNHRKLFLEPLHSGVADGTTTLINGATALLTDIYTTYEFEYTVPANGYWGSIDLTNSTASNIDFYIAWVEVKSYGELFHTTDSYTNNGIFLSDYFQELFYNSATTGTGTIARQGYNTQIRTTAAGTALATRGPDIYFHDDHSWGSDQKFKIAINTFTNTDADMWVGSGDIYLTNGEGYCFYINGGQFYAKTGNGVAETTSAALKVFVPATKYTLEMVFTAGVQCEFYIDGVLEETLTTNLPAGVPTINIVYFGYMDWAAGTMDSRLFLGQLQFVQSE